MTSITLEPTDQAPNIFEAEIPIDWCEEIRPLKQTGIFKHMPVYFNGQGDANFLRQAMSKVQSPHID